MPLTDQNNNPIPMNGEHPARDIFGMSITYGETYYVTPNEEVVHVLSVHSYFIKVLRCEFVISDGVYPKFDIFDTPIVKFDKYYILPNETIVDAINTDEYFVQVLKCDVVKVEE